LDGTFDVVPTLYAQLWTIHGFTSDGWSFPLVYALLPNKSTSSYTYVLETLCSQSRGFILHPDMIIMDFEKAEMNAAEIVFPQAQLQACHFHYTQALKRLLVGRMTCRRNFLLKILSATCCVGDLTPTLKRPHLSKEEMLRFGRIDIFTKSTIGSPHRSATRTLE
jgi:hypothetical protein